MFEKTLALIALALLIFFLGRWSVERPHDAGVLWDRAVTFVTHKAENVQPCPDHFVCVPIPSPNPQP